MVVCVGNHLACRRNERGVTGDLQSSHVRCAFWQWKHARFAFFFLGPSRVRGGWEDESALSLVPSCGRLRFVPVFFFGSASGAALMSEVEDEAEGGRR